jgi:hypothetical protein
MPRTGADAKTLRRALRRIEELLEFPVVAVVVALVIVVAMAGVLARHRRHWPGGEPPSMLPSRPLRYAPSCMADAKESEQFLVRDALAEAEALGDSERGQS